MYNLTGFVFHVNRPISFLFVRCDVFVVYVDNCYPLIIIKLFVFDDSILCMDIQILNKGVKKKISRFRLPPDEGEVFNPKHEVGFPHHYFRNEVDKKVPIHYSVMQILNNV